MGIFLWTIEQPTAASSASSVFFTRDHWATNMISLLLLAGAVAAHPYYYMPYAGLEGRAEPNVDEAEARYLINFGVFQLRSATVASVGTSSVSATVRFFQNPLIANDESRYEVEIVNMVAGTEYFVCLLPTNTQRATPVLTDFLSNEVMTARDETTPVALHSGTAPSFQLFGRFTVRGLTKAFNIDGASGKRDVNTLGVGIFSRACGGLSLRASATVNNCQACVDAGGNGVCDDCVDADADGVCDACDAPCVDADLDGVCDGCVDDDLDGVCDGCVDADLDGACDTPCEDQDMDGDCDACVDDDSDDQCDGCVDDDGDGVCDACVDADVDGDCDDCVDDNGDGVCDAPCEDADGNGVCVGLVWFALV